MKKITFILFALIAGSAFAQTGGTDNATADVDADIVSVISITKDVDLNFGKVISDATGGTVIIGTNSARSGTADYVTVGASPSAASFTIGAETGYTYSISYIGSALSGTGTDMPIAYDLSLPATGNSGGVDTELLIGGTLSVGTTQTVGAYSGTVAVTVSYE
jgi:spore coat protein U-like protein